MIAPALLLTLCFSGCRDHPVASDAEPPKGGARFVATVVCSVDVRAGSTTCEESDPELGGSASAISMNLIRDAHAIVETGDDSYARADSTYRIQVRLRNTTGDLLGTRDGTSATGIRAFLPVHAVGYHGRSRGDGLRGGGEGAAPRGIGPLPLGPDAGGGGGAARTTKPEAFLIPPLANGTDTIHARNPDGRMGFTAPDQPFWKYSEILELGEASEWREWQFTVPPDVSHFYFAVSVFAGVPGEQVVPVTIPDGWYTPVHYHSDSTLVECEMPGAPRCIPGVVVVTFHESASQVERQAAVEAVGTLEGGAWRHYYVRISKEHDPAVMTRALRLLRELPQVEFARPYVPQPITFEHRKPNDGVNWNQWEVRDSSANGRNWALEAISAPLAWGCDTGSVAGLVAVVDSDFHLVADELQTTLFSGNPEVGMLTTSGDSMDHGTRVSAIIAARGNNARPMTGVSWGGSTRAYEIAERDSAGNTIMQQGRPMLTTTRTFNLIKRAVTEGATVVNISSSFNWRAWARSMNYPDWATYDPGTQTDSVRIAARDSIAAQTGREWATVIQDLRNSGRNPLLILAAGNASWSATWNPYTRVPATLRGNLIVVGAASRGSAGTLTRAPFSNWGDTLDIVAPGADVWTLDRANQKAVSGTSYAAPYVAGVAALLVSFDPRLRLHGDSLKHLIMRGAVNGRRTVPRSPTGDTVPVLHAYEALKAAAGRPGSRLCGNRMWTEGIGTPVYVQRDTGVEVIVPTPVYLAAPINVFHSGNAFTATGASKVYRYVNASLSWYGVSPQAGDDLRSGGPFRSAQGRSHEGDSTAVVEQVFDGDLLTGVRPGIRAPDGTTRYYQTIPIPGLSNPGTGCSRWWIVTGECIAWGHAGTWQAASFLLPAYSPQGTHFFVFISIETQSAAQTGSTTIGNVRYASTRLEHQSSGVTAYRIRISDGQRTALWTLPALTLRTPSLAARSENGVFNGYETSVVNRGTCQARFLRIVNGATTYTGSSCMQGDDRYGHGSSTFAP